MRNCYTSCVGGQCMKGQCLPPEQGDTLLLSVILDEVETTQNRAQNLPLMKKKLINIEEAFEKQNWKQMIEELQAKKER